jgi:hypothetical protein
LLKKKVSVLASSSALRENPDKTTGVMFMSARALRGMRETIERPIVNHAAEPKSSPSSGTDIRYVPRDMMW